MNMPVLKAEPGAARAAPPAKILPLAAPRRAPLRARLIARGNDFAARLVPPLIVIMLALLLWEALCRKAGATLPPPSKVITSTWDLIIHPFFVAGPQDIGLGWRVLTSLQRVAIGYGLAGVIGIMLGTIIGQSVWAMRGLDPIFQILRTISPLAWLPISLAAFRDSQPSAIFVIFIT